MRPGASEFPENAGHVTKLTSGSGDGSPAGPKFGPSRLSDTELPGTGRARDRRDGRFVMADAEGISRNPSDRRPDALEEGIKHPPGVLVHAPRLRRGQLARAVQPLSQIEQRSQYLGEFGIAFRSLP